ncbi:unnamed protein product [Effrenium voratum]|uniref:SF4 helicase domain-containing protein n=1 Tax=Effrenium voratum TaxID=2562239 RepID=A0AA36MXZ7_9DINO|nr:unnamed protein product [Effrenium voratum]
MGSCVDFGMLAPTVPARSAPAPKGPQVSSRVRIPSTGTGARFAGPARFPAAAALAALAVRRISRAGRACRADDVDYEVVAELILKQTGRMPEELRDEWVNGLQCPWCGGGRKKEKSFSCRVRPGQIYCKCWRANKCKIQTTLRAVAPAGGSAQRPAPSRSAQVERAQPTRSALGLDNRLLSVPHREYLLQRGITEQVLRRNRVCSKKHKLGNVLVFQYFASEPDSSPRLVAEKVRKLPKEFWQTTGGQKCLYGVDDIKGQPEMVLTEGEIDKLSLEVAGIRAAASLQNGCKGGLSLAFGAEEAFAKAKRIVLAVDGDEGGQACAEELAKRLGKSKRGVSRWQMCYLVKWPEGCKDANEVLMRYGAERLRSLMAEAEPMIKGFDDEVMAEVMARISGTMPLEYISGVSTGWEGVDNFLRIVPGEISVVTGMPGNGKSEWLLSLAVNLSYRHQWRTLLFAFEGKEESLAAQLATKVQATVPQLQDPGVALEWLDEHITLGCSDFEGFTQEKILARAREEKAQGLDLLIVDPYNCIEKSKEEKDEVEHKYIGSLLGKLRKFADEYKVHVVIVAHPTKSAAWLNESPGLYDIAGSAEWFNKTDNGIVVNRRKVELEDGDVVSTRQVEISVKKVRNREAGKLGSAWLLYDAKTRSYSDLQMDLGCEEDDAVPQRAQARTSAHA